MSDKMIAGVQGALAGADGRIAGVQALYDGHTASPARKWVGTQEKGFAKRMRESGVCLVSRGRQGPLLALAWEREKRSCIASCQQWV
jgi:hypothetical protein